MAKNARQLSTKTGKPEPTENLTLEQALAEDKKLGGTGQLPAKAADEPKAKAASKVRYLRAEETKGVEALEWLVQTNPKRGSSKARADKYWNAPTVAEYLAAGGTKADLRWDMAHGFVRAAAQPQQQAA